MREVKVDKKNTRKSLHKTDLISMVQEDYPEFTTHDIAKILNSADAKKRERAINQDLRYEEQLMYILDFVNQKEKGKKDSTKINENFVESYTKTLYKKSPYQRYINRSRDYFDYYKCLNDDKTYKNQFIFSNKSKKVVEEGYSIFGCIKKVVSLFNSPRFYNYEIIINFEDENEKNDFLKEQEYFFSQKVNNESHKILKEKIKNITEKVGE